MGKFLIVTAIVVFLTQYSVAVQYVFHAPSYTLVEVPGTKTTYTDVIISRTDESTQEMNSQRTVIISTKCQAEHPHSLTATASSDDYTVPSLTVVFAAGELEKAVPVTIETDDIQESTEFFCVTIEDDPGSQYTTRIIIPENDYCYEVTPPSEESDPGVTPASGNDPDIRDDNQYVGPWLTSVSDVIEFEISPAETENNGGNFMIFIANVANINDPNLDFYQIILDDSAAGYHGSTTDGDTTLYRGGVPDFGGTFLDEFVSYSGEGLVKDDGSETFRFWLKYEESSGTISIGDPSDRTAPIASYSDGSASALTVKHIFVKKPDGFATFKVCLAASPRKIDATGASAVGYQTGGSPDHAIDGDRNIVFEGDSCFLSSTVDDPWLQIDLGQVYDVRFVLIWKVMDNDLGAEDSDIHGAEVLVGSCPAANVAGNIPCEDVDTGVGDTAFPIESECASGTYGRYVYIYLPTTNADTTQFSLCEVDVYGTVVPYGSETTVQFTQSEYIVNENGGPVSIGIYRAYPVPDTATCTNVEYYTDSGVIVSSTSANSNDFVAILNDPLTANMRRISWNETDVSGNDEAVVRSFPITINDDNPGVCEAPEEFFIYLANVVGGINGDQYWASVKIIDEDSLSYSFTQDTFTAPEGDASVDIEVQRDGVGVMQVGSAELLFTDGTATSADYDNTVRIVNFDVSNNADFETGDVEIEDDEWYEESESFTVNFGTLTPNDGCSLPGQYESATVIITDNDSRFRFAVDNGASITIPEGETMNIRISREGTTQEKSLEIVVNDGTADLGDDFTISPSTTGSVSTVIFVAEDDDTTITINAQDDSEIESSETFTLTLRDPLHPSGNRAEPYSLTVTIIDTDGRYYWKQQSYSVQESSGSLTVCLLRSDDLEARTVYITSASVSATPGADYTPLTEINFMEGLSEACAQVEILGGTALEGNEIFTLTVGSGQSNVVNPQQNVATVTIIDDDNFVGWSQAAYAFAEGSVSNDVVISKSGVSTVSVTVTITSGTATQYKDFDLSIGSSSSITIPNGAQSYTLPVTIINDNEDEDNEIFTLTLSSASGAVISQAQTNITITDDDDEQPAPADKGIGGAAISGIIVAAIVGLILIILIVTCFCYMTGGFTRARPVAITSVPSANYPPRYAINNGLGYGGYGPRGLPNAGYVGNNPYIYGRRPYP